MKYVKHVTPVLPRQARGITSIIYREAAHEMGRLPEPVAVFSPHLDLLTATWATLRESLVVGSAPRGLKEAVAATVAADLRCPWCVDAHTTMLYATGHAAAAESLLESPMRTADDPAAVYILDQSSVPFAHRCCCSDTLSTSPTSRIRWHPGRISFSCPCRACPARRDLSPRWPTPATADPATCGTGVGGEGAGAPRAWSCR